jgi:hypothetical protein
MRALHASFRAETNSEVMLRRDMNQESEANTFQVSMSKKDTLREPQDFSLVLGGPLFQLLRRAHLSDDALELVRQRIVGISLFAWLPLLAGLIANHIFYVGAELPQFKVEIAVLAVFLLCLALGPLLVFAPQLAQAKRMGNREHGALAERYVREFDAKWLLGGAPASRW